MRVAPPCARFLVIGEKLCEVARRRQRYAELFCVYKGNNAMPVLLKKHHPMIPLLQQEGCRVLEKKAEKEVLRIGLLNLMPKKIETEGHFARVLSHSVVNVELVFLKMTSYTPQHVSQEHMRTFYQPWTQYKEHPTHLDGLIVTGAPVELLDYEEVDYWKELVDVFAMVREHKICTLFICWAAQAALYAYWKINKHRLPEKAFGIYRHQLTKTHPLFLGFDDSFLVPVSRHTTIRKEDVAAIDAIQILAESPRSGLYALCNTELSQFFLFNHLEYEAETIGNEYTRDLERGDAIVKPHNYFVESAEGTLLHRWRSYATLLHSNWLHICVNEQEKRMNGMRRARVGIAGQTELAHAVAQQFYKRRDVIETKTNTYIELVMSKPDIAVQEDQKQQDHQGVVWAANDTDLVEHEDIDVVVETHKDEILGKELVEAALAHRKPVIATNARILAEYGLSIIRRAESQHTAFSYESIVGSGIPVLKTVREALASDHIKQIHAVLSAPSNMLLDIVEQRKTSVAALQKGPGLPSDIGRYADLFPLEDRYVSGYDTAFKLNVLSCIGFGKNYLVDAMPIHGIDAVAALDVHYARHSECTMKVCGYARDEGEYIAVWVGPMFLPHTKNSTSYKLAQVENSQNALHCRSQAVGDLFLQGPGIGAEPAANAVLSDLVDILVRRSQNSFGVPARDVPTLECRLPQQRWQWYVRSSVALPYEVLPYTHQENFQGSWCLLTEQMTAQQFLERRPPEVIFFAPYYVEEGFV